MRLLTIAAVGLLAVAMLAAPVQGKVDIRRVYFHSADDHTPNPWFNFDPEDPDAGHELHQDTYIGTPATGMNWFSTVDLSPQADEEMRLSSDRPVNGTLVFCSDVFLYYSVEVEMGIGRIVGEDVVEGVGPTTGCAEVPFAIQLDNATIHAGDRVWFNINPETQTISGLMQMTVSQHDSPSYVDLPVVVPDEPADQKTPEENAPSDEEPSGGNTSTDDGTPTEPAPPDDGDDAEPTGGSGPSTPGFGVVALLAAALVALVGRRS